MAEPKSRVQVAAGRWCKFAARLIVQPNMLASQRLHHHRAN
jgi:hypothetical protein